VCKASSRAADEDEVQELTRGARAASTQLEDDGHEHGDDEHDDDLGFFLQLVGCGFSTRSRRARCGSTTVVGESADRLRSLRLLRSPPNPAHAGAGS